MIRHAESEVISWCWGQCMWKLEELTQQRQPGSSPLLHCTFDYGLEPQFPHP